MTFSPKPIGSESSRSTPNCAEAYSFLHPGKRYRVIRKFTDYDQHVHPEGESWSFLGYSFSPYDDGMSFFVSFDDRQEWHIRLQWRPEGQGDVLDNLAEYISAL